jgi:hypothetical protein
MFFFPSQSTLAEMTSIPSAVFGKIPIIPATSLALMKLKSIGYEAYEA